MRLPDLNRGSPLFSPLIPQILSYCSAPEGFIFTTLAQSCFLFICSRICCNQRHRAHIAFSLLLLRICAAAPVFAFAPAVCLYLYAALKSCCLLASATSLILHSTVLLRIFTQRFRAAGCFYISAVGIGKLSMDR
jgi:hypothetical protein